MTYFNYCSHFPWIITFYDSDILYLIGNYLNLRNMSAVNTMKHFIWLDKSPFLHTIEIHSSIISAFQTSTPTLLTTNFQGAISTVKTQRFELHQYILICHDTFEKKKKSILQISTNPTVFLDKRLQSIRICYYLASTVWLFVREEPLSCVLLSVLLLPRLCSSGSRVPAVVDLQIVRSASDRAPANVQR